MKRTLLLTALLGGMPALAGTVSVFADGYGTDNYLTAYNYKMVGKMCWGANAANIISWWQDQLVAQGYTLPQGVPTKNNVFAEYRAGLNEYKGGYPDSAVEWWLDGYYYGTKNNDPDHPGAFYDELLKTMEHNIYHDTGTMIKQFFPATCGSRKALSQHIVETLQQGYALIADVGSTSVTVWGADYDTESGLLTHVYYSDPHDTTKVWHGALTNDVDAVGQETFFIAGTGTIGCITGLPCHIEEFLTEAAYTDTGSGAFAPNCNVELDNGGTYTISRELKAAAEGSALKGKANGDITIKDGTAILAEGGSTEGTIVFTGETAKSRTLSVQADGLTLTGVKVNAATGSNTLAVAEGKALTVSSMEGEGTLVKTGEGTLVNGGSLGNLVVQEGTVKGSGTFGAVTVDGGTLVVGNSPGRQEYLAALSVKTGEIVFSVDGWETPAYGEQVGWGSGTYSNIVMNGHALTFGDGAQLKFAVGGSALATLLSGAGGSYTMELATKLGNGKEYFTSTLLDMLAKETIFYVAQEPGATIVNDAGLSAGQNLNSRITDLVYSLKDNSTLCVTGVFMLESPAVPEPATGTLGLLALCALAARRRK